MEEIYFCLKIKQIPNIYDLTELEFIYYSVGHFYIEQNKEKALSEILTSTFKEFRNTFEYFAYEMADMKTLLYDLSSCTRGLSGVKTRFNINDLPSVKNRKIENKEPDKNESEEEKRERHKRFFEELKQSFINK